MYLKTYYSITFPFIRSFIQILLKWDPILYLVDYELIGLKELSRKRHYVWEGHVIGIWEDAGGSREWMWSYFMTYMCFVDSLRLGLF